MNTIEKNIIFTIKNIINLLVSKEYQKLEELSKGIRLNQYEIKQSITDYSDELIFPLSDDLKNIDVIEIIDSNPQSWSVRYDLWTKKEGRSDLSLEVTLIDNNEKLLNIEIDNIHVL